MKKQLVILVIGMLVGVASLTLVGCSDATNPQVEPSGREAQTTVVTDENYGLAESEVIFTDYVQKIAAATNTNGVGVLMHLRKGADPKDRTIMRINFDTIYSVAIIDLTEDAVLTMPETNGRYQSAWIITDEHYNPMAFVEPGTYTLTQEKMGRRYIMLSIRTQTNTADPADLAIANALQDQLKLEQKDRGSFAVSGNWDMKEILAMRAKYQKIQKKEGITSERMFGKKGELPLKDHNVGTASGWGGLTAERAVYPTIYAKSTKPQTFTLKDVPAKAFWSITVYDADGYPQGDVYNINSEFAIPNKDGSVTIHFGGDKNAVNYMDIFEDWNLALRIYEPSEAYFNGEWAMPKLEIAELSPIEAKSLAKRAFLFTFPWAASYHSMGKMSMDMKTGEPFKVGINQVVYNDRTFTAKDKTMPMVNSSNFTTGLWMDLREDPIIVTIPKTDIPSRYFSVMYLGTYHYISTSYGSRLANVGEERKVLFYSDFSNWDGKLPAGVESSIKMETAFAALAIRLGVNASDPKDVEAVRKLMRGTQAQTLNEYLGKDPIKKSHIKWLPIGKDYSDLVNGEQYLKVLKFMANLSVPHVNDTEEWKVLDQLGLGQGGVYDENRFAPEVLAAIRSGMVEAFEEVGNAPVGSAAGLFKSREDVGVEHQSEYYTLNTKAAYFGYMGQPNYEVTYLTNFTDADGEEFDGSKHSYTIHYADGGFPPVSAFWAYTLYTKPAFYLYDNSVDKYTIDSLQGYAVDENGALTIHVAHEQPAGVPDANWLPAPDGPFALTLRLYNPGESALDGSWTQAVIRKAD